MLRGNVLLAAIQLRGHVRPQTSDRDGGCGEGARLKRPGAGELRCSVLLGVQGHDMAMSLSLGDAESGTPSCSMRLLYAPSSSTPLH